jgi:hypothetical protein
LIAAGGAAKLRLKSERIIMDPKIATTTRQLQEELRDDKYYSDQIRSTYSLSDGARCALHELACTERCKLNDLVNVAVEDLLAKHHFVVDLTRLSLRERLSRPARKSRRRS